MLTSHKMMAYTYHANALCARIVVRWLSLFKRGAAQGVEGGRPQERQPCARERKKTVETERRARQILLSTAGFNLKVKQRGDKMGFSWMSQKSNWKVNKTISEWCDKVASEGLMEGVTRQGSW